MTMKTKNEQLKKKRRKKTENQPKQNTHTKQRHELYFILAICQMVIDRLLWLLVAVYIDFLRKIILFSPHNNRKIEKHLNTDESND